MIIVLLIRIILVVLTLYISHLSVWRTYEREHVDDIPQLFDRVLIAALVSWYLSRLPSAIDMVIHHTLPPIGMLNPMTGSASWQVGIIIFCIGLYISLRENWRDRYALLDFTVSSLPLFLAGYFFWQLSTLIVSSMLGDTALPWGYVVTLIVGVVYSLVFHRLLNYFERQYRAYFWYRYRRSSAQTGFVTSAFCIGLGLFGLVANIYLLPFSILSLTSFLTIWSLFTMVAGFIVLYIRSGRLKKK